MGRGPRSKRTDRGIASPQREDGMERNHELGCGHRRIDLEGPRRKKAFELPGAKPSYLPDRPFTVAHYALAVRLDFEQKALEGEAVLTVHAQRRTERLLL